MPRFSEATIEAHEKSFTAPVHDQGFYATASRLLVDPPKPTRDPFMTLAEVWEPVDPNRVKAITAAGRIVFHSVGDTGPTVGPNALNRVVDAMMADFKLDPADPAFFMHLGDVVYSFGEAQYYYEQFFDPYRNYAAPIFAVAGNHDGLTYSGDKETALAAFLQTFCAAVAEHNPLAGTIPRPTNTQPGVYFGLEAPYVSIIGLFSNVLESPGVIGTFHSETKHVGPEQLQFLHNALARAGARRQATGEAVLIAVHHPPISGDGQHGGSPGLLHDLDAAVAATGVTPDAVFSGHVHQYQRFTRVWNGRPVPFIVAGNGGHGLLHPQAEVSTPTKAAKHPTAEVKLEHSANAYGFTRVTADATTLKIEFVELPAASARKVKAPAPAAVSDSVVVKIGG